MTKRAWALTIGAIVLALAVGLGLGSVLGGGESSPASTVSGASSQPSSPPSVTSSDPATTTPSVPPTTPPATAAPATVSTRPTGLPVPALGSLQSAQVQTLFDWFSAPIPQAWNGTMSDGDSKGFADTSTCVTDNADCAHIEFLSLRSGPNHVNYGDNPVVQWAKDVCPSRSTDSVVGPIAFKVDGVDAKFYKFPCQGGPEHYLWYVPSKKLLVRGDDGDGTATLETGIVQAVLESATWH